MTKERKGVPVKYHLFNWPEYNNALIERGKMAFMITSDIADSWLVAEPENKLPGGQPKFTNLAIEICLKIRELFQLQLRQTQGFVCGLFDAANIDLPVPNYTLLSKRSEELNLSVKRYRRNEKQLPNEPLCITMDSTGLKIYGEGEWLNEKHKKKMRKSWRKAHIAINQYGEVVAESLTTTAVGDPTEAVNLLAQFNNNIDQFLGDGAYDTSPLHAELEHRYPGVDIVTPPRKDAVISSRNHPTQRDKHIMRIEEKGRAAWQAISGYNQRNLVENTMFRIKTIFGGKLKARKIEKQQTELTIKCSLLNQMSSLGMPDAYKVRSN
jgi:hypothetical protein